MTEDLTARLSALADLPDQEVPLAEAALLLAARDRPGVLIDRFRHHLHLLAGALKAEATKTRAETAEAQALALAQTMAGLMGYRGDSETYDDLMNANLMHVIDRRRGLPVALAILYLHAARAQGWDAQGLNFPGHFLIRLEAGGQRAILDPFHQGQALGAGELRELLKRIQGKDSELQPGHFEPLSNRDILLRLQNNIKVRLVQNNEMERAVAVLADMAAFAPRHAPTLYELGALEGHLGHIRAALGWLRRCADISGPLQGDARALMASFQNQLN